MLDYKLLFTAYLDAKGVRYVDQGEHVVKITYEGDNLKSIPVYVFFDEDGEPLVQLKCWDVVSCKDKEDKGIRICNDLNNKYRWVKFSVDNDSDVVISIDAYIDGATCGEECLKLVARVVNITDNAYPDLVKAIF